MDYVKSRLPAEMWAVFEPPRNWNESELQALLQLVNDYDRKMCSNVVFGDLTLEQITTGDLLVALCKKNLLKVLLSAIVSGCRCGLLPCYFKIFNNNKNLITRQEIKDLVELLYKSNLFNLDLWHILKKEIERKEI